MTGAEMRIWRYLRSHRYNRYSFRRQMPIGPYVVDFICLAARLIIEIDGGQHTSITAGRDRTRDAWLHSHRFRILRFWNNDVLANMDGVLETIAGTLAQSLPPSLTLPRKGGGDRLRYGEKTI
ncbi:MAG: endonuclease domain-containing protein [Rhizobiales bacterium]|nr:endonuclease domain-containing protein [Hyphomicrobiales bacterium]